METADLSRSSAGLGVSSKMKKAFQLEDRSSQWGAKIWTLVFDLPGEKVNKFGDVVFDELNELLPELEKLGKEGKIDALVMFSGKPGNFIAGADITLIQAAKNASDAEALSRKGQIMLDRWEDLPFPTVIGIEGACLGGGFELSLASSAILMSDDKSTRIGFPEVLIGFVPGMGGCVRCPQKVGLATALDLILTGKNLDGKRAQKAGLAEACLAKENFKETALAWVNKNHKKLRRGRKLGIRLAREPKLGGMGGFMGKMLEGTPMGRSMILSKAREGVMKKTRGHYPAPLEAIRVIKDNGTKYGPPIFGKKREKALIREARGFGKTASTDVSKNLIRLFFLTEAVKKSNGLSDGQTVNVPKVSSAAVLGAGVMGGGIAQLLADKEIHARMKDLNTEALALGVESASRVFKKKVKRRRLTQREYLQKLNHIAPVLDYSGFQNVEVVVEAIIEKMDIKKTVLKEVEGKVDADCVLASNTSSLSISEMQSVLQRPERFVGMHFFNPVHRMPLIEVIRGEKSSDEAVATIYEFSKKLGKTPIVVRDGAGFLVNRLLVPYLNEAMYLLEEGCSAEALDKAYLGFGMPMGPCELIDEVGMDVGHKVLYILFDAFGERMKPSKIAETVTKSGRLGKKTNKGFYIYDPKSKRKLNFDPEIYKVMGRKGNNSKISKEEMVDRGVLTMINEAARCLEDKIVEKPDDVDLGMIMGTGFPPFRGGLMRYADSLGAMKIVEKLKTYESRFGSRFSPAPLLLAKAEQNETFY